MANPTGNSPVRVFAREFFGVSAGFRVWRAVGLTFKCDGRYSNYRAGGEALFQLVIFRLAFCQAEPPAVIVDDDADVIVIVEGGRAAIEGGVVEIPFRRSELPNQLRKIVPVFFVTST